MEHINGQNNSFTITLPNKTIDCISSDDEKYKKLIDQGNITITGNNNHISMRFDSEDSA